MTLTTASNPRYNFIIVLIKIIVFVGGIYYLCSCSKNIHKNKNSVDSTVVHQQSKILDSNATKTAIKRRNVITNNTKKVVTTTTPILIEVDTSTQNYDHTAKDYLDLPIVHSKGKTFVIAPKIKTVELDHFNKIDTGSESNSQITNTHQSVASNDITHLKKKEKDVVKESGFNWWLLLWLIPIIIGIYCWNKYGIGNKIKSLISATTT
jgi:hypothetical protein